MSNNQCLTPFQIFSLLFGGMLGFGALTISRYATNSAGRDGWISVLLAGIIIILNSFVIIKLNNRFSEKTIIQYSQDILGKFLGKTIGLLLVLSALCISGLTLAMTAYVINSWILVYTPPYAIYASMLFLCVYACLKDLKVIGRIATFLFFLHIVFFFLFLPPLAQTGNIMSIFPIAKTGWSNIIKGIVPVLFCFAGYELISVFHPFADDKKKSSKAAIWSVVAIVLIYTFAVITQIVTFPLDYLKKLWVPSANFIALIYVPFLERLDIIFISSWIYVFFKVLTAYFYAATIEIQQIWCIKNRNNICYFIAPIVFLIAFFSGNIKRIESLTYWVASLTVFISLIIPIVLLVLSILLKKGKVK
jgi:spore germination protein (amino acid permease)